MKPMTFHMQEDLVCINYGYKPSNLHRWGPGVRDVYALHYIISGKGCLETNDTIYTIKTGESFLICPQMEVFYYPDPGDPWEYIWIEFKGEEALRLLRMTQLSPHNPVTSASNVNLEPLFRIEESTGMQQFEKERANARLHLLLSYYIENYPRTNNTIKTDYVTLAKECIENNYWKENLTVSDIVDYVKIDRTYLFRRFKEATGMSISGYLTAYRIQRACVLLETYGLSIKSIACSVGYKDQLYFSRVFKKVTTLSPSEYAKKHTDKREKEL
jgi:AraC-like DNA-binding protein